MNEELSGVRAYVSVNKALVTQSSAAIPVVPLYISILYKVMKEKGVHEGCIEQMYRLFHDKLYGIAVRTDTNGYVRLDDYEMQPDVQEEVLKIWDALSEKISKQCGFGRLLGGFLPAVRLPCKETWIIDADARCRRSDCACGNKR